ncbi:RNA polymerase I enhancer binding protein [Entomortierella beljakovae]|nr:RNA polymerase I enhancer binding protein [Entomortierella beljakovae]
MGDEHKSKKRKKEKSKNRDNDELNAGIFKKALITPTGGVNSPATSAFDGLDMLSSEDDASDSSGDEAPKRKQAPIARGTISAAEILSSTSAPKASQNTTKTPSMADVADIIAKASRKHTNSGIQVNDSLTELQQQLGQSSSTGGTTLSSSDLLKSMGVYPAMEMILRTTLGDQQQDLNLPTQTAANILANLDSDPSVLATVNNTSLNNNMGQQQRGAGSQDVDSSKKKEKKKKSKSKDPKEPKDKSSKKSEGSSSKASMKSIRDLSAQLEKDLSSLSDNPLHTKWMMATELKEKGIEYKTGTFTAKEDSDIKETVREYLAQHNMDESALVQWFQGGDGKAQVEKNELKPLWVQIAVKLEHRPLLNIYLHIRRLYHPQNNVGQWTKEDDAKLVELHAKHKGRWTTIGQELGRMADSCRDRYRNHLKDQSTMISGTWAAHEDETLLEIMHDQALLQGKSNILESTYLWTTVSEKMGGSRSRHQCRHRFSQSLQARLERGDFKGTRAGDAVAASLSGFQQQNSQQGIQSQSDSSIITASQEDERLKNLTDVLQGVIPASESLLWTQAMTTSAVNGEGFASTSSSSNSYQDFSNLGKSSTIGTQPSGLFKSSGAPACPKARQQLLIEILKTMQKHGYGDHLEVKWNDLMKEIKTGLQEKHNIQLAKFSKVHQQLQRQAKQHLQDGDVSSFSATAAAAAMTVAIAAVQNESMKVMNNTPAGNQALRSFLAGRAKIEGYRELGLKTVIEVMLKSMEEKIDRRDRKVHATALANAQKSGGTIDSDNVTQRNTPKSLGPVHQRHLAEFAHSAVLEALLTQFPLLNQLRQRQQQKQQAGGDITEDEQEGFSWASITTAVDRSMDEDQQEQVLEQQSNRILAEKMIHDAMLKQGLPTYSNRPQKRSKLAEGFKTKEYVSDTDMSDNGSDDEDD